GGGRRSVTTIDDTEVPQAVMIPDPEIPLAALPKTGDTTPLLMLGAMTAVSFLLLSALGVLWFRTRRKEDQV
ncbi:LPXTG cell wall anchor domain-containing protein, partial [Enterocloster citroniae]|nr:LPXTG cell wall anchor domain-containing protein [Enterocloster citroniae]